MKDRPCRSGPNSMDRYLDGRHLRVKNAKLQLIYIKQGLAK
ncbi:hypothetical protein SL1157_2808 [Ruegeria lacuscaerulensis ITI-1157]|nr:hypothetical protein SL1157_2808 [Ruegeria lacuscaerulensis ITI-1157]